MAVVINGTTGIDTIQDGIVTTAKIGAGQITDAKLASTLDISGKTVTYGLSTDDLPSGSVLRVYHATNTSGVTVNNTTFVDLGLTFSNVVINSGESPLLFCSVGVRRLTASQGHCAIGLRYTGSATGDVFDSTWGYGIQQQSDSWSWDFFNISGVNLKNARANPFNSTGTFTFYVKGCCINPCQFGGEQNSPAAGYSSSQATMMIIKD